MLVLKPQEEYAFIGPMHKPLLRYHSYAHDNHAMAQAFAPAMQRSMRAIRKPFAATSSTCQVTQHLEVCYRKVC